MKSWWLTFNAFCKGFKYFRLKLAEPLQQIWLKYNFVKEVKMKSKLCKLNNMEGETCGCLGSEKQTIACVYSLLRGIIWRKVWYSFDQVGFFQPQWRLTWINPEIWNNEVRFDLHSKYDLIQFFSPSYKHSCNICNADHKQGSSSQLNIRLIKMIILYIAFWNFPWETIRGL